MRQRLVLFFALAVAVLVAVPPASAASVRTSSHGRGWSIGIGFGSGGYGFGGWGYDRWGSGYGYGYDPYYGRSPYRYGAGRMNYGAVDCDVDPEEAEVYVNGRRMGVADDFDGFPELLVLRAGTYRIEFYKDGFRTESRQVRLRRGEKIEVEGKLERLAAGEAAERPLPKAGERDPEAELDRDDDDFDDRARPRSRRWDRDDPDDGDDLEDRYDDDRRDADDERYERRGSRENDRGTLELEVEPGDASVYIDGKFVGTGRDLERRGGRLPLSEGTHTLEIVHPGFREHQENVEVVPGRSLSRDVDLKRLN